MDVRGRGGSSSWRRKARCWEMEDHTERPRVQPLSRYSLQHRSQSERPLFARLLGFIGLFKFVLHDQCVLFGSRGSIRLEQVFNLQVFLTCFGLIYEATILFTAN